MERTWYLKPETEAMRDIQMLECMQKKGTMTLIFLSQMGAM